jgi:Tol biopolymer transport system component
MRWLGLVALSAVLLTVVAAGAAAHGDTTRISLSSGPANTQGSDSSVDASMSGNGNLVVFKSNATNLVAHDTNGSVADIYLRDRAAGTTNLVSVDVSGNQFTSASEEPAISFDGTVVTWVTGGQVYVRTLPNGPTELASRTFAGQPADGVSHEPALSADGNLVAFWSHANNIGTPDPVGTADIFVYNRTTHGVELDSVGTGGTPAGSGDDSFLPALSGDGRYVVFETKAPFDAAHDTNGTYDIYLHDRVAGTTRLISHAAGGTAGNAQSFEGNGGPVISQDGSTVAFASDASNLVPGDNNNRTDIFVWHAASNTLERASVSSSGVEGTGASSRPAINADGTFVAFESESQLHPWDTNTDIDVYVRHLGENPERTTLESLSAQGQVVSGNKLNPVISGDGALIAFHSSSPALVTGDTNGRDDVFVHELGVADITPPTVTGTAATPANANGWYNGNVLVHWTATDPEPSSGQPAAVPDTTASTEGANQTFTSPPACDANANCATGTIKLSIDKTPPVATATTNIVNTNGWYNADVVVGFTCSDALSGIASCPGAVHFTTEGVNQTIPPAGRTATDRAGNTTVVPVAPVSIDETPPTITFSGATTYSIDGTVSITCTAADALSGIASSTCTPVSGPAYVFAIGANVITATATDKAGNVTSATYTFTVTATIDDLKRFICNLLGTGPGKPKHRNDLCRKLSDDLDGAHNAEGHGDTKKRDEDIRKFLKDASNHVGQSIEPNQMTLITRLSESITG